MKHSSILITILIILINTAIRPCTIREINHLFSSTNWSLNLYHVTRFTYARKTIRHVCQTKASLHLDSSGNSTRTLRARVFNRRCPFSFLTPLRGRVIFALVSLFFSTSARPSERSIYRRMNPPSSLSNHDPFYLRRLEVSQTIEKIYVNTHFICLVKRSKPFLSPATEAPIFVRTFLKY